MFALLCVTFPLAMTRFDAEGVPLPLGVTARYGSTRFVATQETYRVRYLPGEKTAISLGASVVSVWNLETGSRIREIVESDWECRDFQVSRDGRKLYTVGLATTGHLDKTVGPMDGQPGRVEKTPIQRVELWTYDTATFQRIAKTILTETFSQFFWFNTNGTLLIPDNTSRQNVTFVTIEPELKIVTLAIDFREIGFFYPAYNETGTRLAYCTQKEVIVYDTAAKKEVARYSTNSSWCVALSKDGNTVYGVGRDPDNSDLQQNPYKLFSWNVITQKTNWTHSFADEYSTNLAWNVPIDDIVPVMGEGLINHDITHYSAKTGKLIPLEPGETYHWRYARLYGQLNADRTRLLAMIHGGISIWDVATRQQILPKNSTFSIAAYSRIQYLDGGTNLEVGPYDSLNHLSGLKSWDVATGKELLSIPPHRLVEDGGMTLVKHDTHGQRYDVTARNRAFRVTMVPEHDDPTKAAKGIPVLSDPNTGREICRLAGGPSVGNELQITRDGRYLICHGTQFKTWRWDLRQVDPQPVEIGVYTGGNSGFTHQQCVTVSPDQTIAAVINRAETNNANNEPPQYEVGVYRLETAKPIRVFKGPGSLTRKIWSANSRYLGLTTDKDFTVYDLETDRRFCQLKEPFYGSLRDDGRMLCSAQGKEVTFRDTLTGQVSHTIALSSASNSVAFSPDRRSVAYVASDNTVHVLPLFPLSKDVPISRAEMDAAFPDLASKDARKAFLAVRLFASDAKSVAYLREKIPPAKLPADVATLIANLDSPRFAERDAATKRLTELGTAASGPLQLELTNTASVESRTRIEQILATHGTASPDDLRAYRAHEILDILDTPEARSLREVWAKGEPSLLTDTAKGKPRNATAKRTP